MVTSPLEFTEDIAEKEQLPTEQQRFKPDDDELAIELAEHWQGKVAYFYGGWHVYESGCWQPRQLQEVRMAVRKFLRPYRYGKGRYAPVFLSRTRVAALVDMAQDDCFIPDRQLMGAGRQYINLKNGLYNLDTGKLEKHRADMYLTHQLDITYDEDADCPNWRRYIRSSLVDDKGETDWKLGLLLQEAVGYSLTADTSLKAAFWLVGKRDSGKSTLIAVLRALAGSLHATIDLNQLGANRFLLSSIVGKRIVTFTESSANSLLPDALFKALVGGSDEIYADVKNKEAITFVPEAKMWWAMNSMPRVSDRSGAVFSRLHIIPFNRTIPPDERIGNLLELLEQERAGIFNWAMVGYNRLRRAGQFEQCEQSVRLREEYELENDTERSYLSQRTQPDPESSILSSELYYDYRTWCQDNGFQPKNINQVARDWERLKLRKVRRNEGVYWFGVRFNA